MKKTTWPGNYKFACHVCGFWYPSGEIKKRWDGVYVCHKDWETRHPQTLIKIRGERAFPEIVSKDVSPDPEVEFCDIFKSSSYASMAAAGCARAGILSPTYSALLDLLGNGHGNGTFTTITDTTPQWLAVQGRDIVTAVDRKPFYPFGTNQRFWFPQAKDGPYLARTILANTVRIEYPFWQQGESGEGRQDGAPGNMTPSYLVELDRVVNLWTSNGIRVDIACHSKCGRSGTAADSDDGLYCALPDAPGLWPHGRNFWTDTTARARWLEFLVFVAIRYKDNPLVSIIEPLNEPDPDAVTDAQVAQLLWAASDLIHENNPNILVMLGGSGGYNPTKISSVYSVDRPWQIYTFDWFDQPGNDPNNPNPPATRMASLLTRLTQPLALRSTANVPVMPQQFGSHYGVDVSREVLAYALGLLLKNKMPGFQWEYRSPTVGPTAGAATYGWIWDRGDGVDTYREIDQILMASAGAGYKLLQGTSLN